MTSQSNAELALSLLADATAETAREAGQRIRDDRVEGARRERQRVVDDRRREVRSAFRTALERLWILGGVWLFLCFLILANNFVDNPFADGSYAVTTWTFILVLVAGLVIDLSIGPGRDGWFIGGAAFGFALSAWYTLSRPQIAAHPMDVSMFWLTGLFGVAAYLVSALRARS